jgi:type II secretory pathway component GspD/PulD (secretin)
VGGAKGAPAPRPPSQSACYSSPVSLSITTLSLDELVSKLCETADYYCEKNPKGWWEVRRYQTARIEFPTLFSTALSTGTSSAQSSYTYDDSFFVKQVVSLLSAEGRLIRSGAGFVVVKDRPSYVKKIVEVMNYQKEHTQPLRLTVKVLRVDLSKGREAGIDWNAVLHKVGGILTASSSYATNSITGNAFSFTLNRSNLSALLKVLEQYGKVHTLKEWTTITIAGKPLYTNSIEKIPWFQKVITQNAQTTEKATQINFEEVGLKIGVLPEVVDDDVLKGSLYAEMSSLLGFEESQDGDKAPRTAVSNAFVNFSIPFGSVLVVSGLKEKQVESGHSGIPVLSKLPVVGSLFGWQYKREKNSEIVVIVEPSPILGGE